MNVIICHTQVPFARGGAEAHVEGLRDALRQAGHRAEIVALPLKAYPRQDLLKTALAWRLLDLSESNHLPVDLVICTKFPTWAVRHPRKVAWVIHQHRQAFDLLGTPLSDFTSSIEDIALRRQIVEVDRRGLGECRALYANSANVAGRLERSTGLKATPLHVPIRLTGLQPESYDDYILSISRLDPIKRVDLLLEALAAAGGTSRAVIVGEGADMPRLQGLARQLGVAERVQFLGAVSDAEVVRLYNHARGVYYSPLDEDFGLVTVEAFSAGKPVLTAADSGGVLELVEDGVTGIVAEVACGAALGAGLRRLMDELAFAERLGSAGRRRVASIRWDRVVKVLTRHA